MIVWHEYNAATGLFTGRRKTSSKANWSPAQSETRGWKEGSYSSTTHRVDLETGEVVSYTPPPPSIEQLREERWAKVKRDRDAAQHAGFAVPGIGTFQSDPESQRLLTGAVVLANISLMQQQPFAMTWTLADNSAAVLDAEQMIGAGIALGMHIDACHQAGRAARAAIAAAQTAEEVAAVEFVL